MRVLHLDIPCFSCGFKDKYNYVFTLIFNPNHANKTCGLVAFHLAIRLVVWV